MATDEPGDDRTGKRVAKKLIEWGAEGLWQQAVVNMASSLIGGAAVTALVALLRQNWKVATCVGVLACVLIYVVLSEVSSRRQLRRSIDSANGVFFDLERSVSSLASKVASFAAPRAQSPAEAAAERVLRGRPSYVDVQLSHGTNSLRGIGLVGEPTIAFNGDARPNLFECSCTVDLVGLAKDVVASPLELLLTSPGGGVVLSRLETSGPAIGAGLTTYKGTAELQAMANQIDDTMLRLFPRPWNRTTPIEPGVFCEVEIRLPLSLPLADHRKSLVKLDFELPGAQSRRFLVRVANAKSS